MMGKLCLQFFFKIIPSSLLVMVIIARFKAQQCGSRYYEIVSFEGSSLPPEEIISSHNVEHPVDPNCNYICFNAGSKCVGFNFRAKTNAINCQLTNTSKSRIYREEGEWSLALYRDEEENEKVKTPTGGLYDSEILNQQQNYIVQLEEWLDGAKPWKLCYRATDDGWLASTFHDLCDFKKPTVTIIRSGSYIFGAYTDAAFGGSSSTYKAGSNSFIFSFVNKDNFPPFKSPVKVAYPAIYTSPIYGPVFGGGPDIRIANNANANIYSQTYFGISYELPTGYSYRSTKAKELLAGSYYFTPNEVETFYLN